jgi:hypothetical protein
MVIALNSCKVLIDRTHEVDWLIITVDISGPGTVLCLGCLSTLPSPCPVFIPTIVYADHPIKCIPLVTYFMEPLIISILIIPSLSYLGRRHFFICV